MRLRLRIGLRQSLRTPNFQHTQLHHTQYFCNQSFTLWFAGTHSFPTTPIWYSGKDSGVRYAQRFSACAKVGILVRLVDSY